MHQENRFEPGDFVIHKGPSTIGDMSFVHNVSRVLEDTGEFITVESPCGGKIYAHVLHREEYPHFIKATEIQADTVRERFQQKT